MRARGIVAALALAAGLAHAQGHVHAKAHAPAKPAQTAFGIAGDPSQATRTVTVDMTDQMRFIPDALSVRTGETVRFVLANKGTQMHEMVIGTPKDLARHAQMMRNNQHMQHDDAHMAHVRPGASSEIVWNFNRAGTFQFACLVPGHYEAGMIGTVTVK